ncbi:MAG: peptidylprolyl isomerase [Oscillospiraceae bacterium]
MLAFAGCGTQNPGQGQGGSRTRSAVTSAEAQFAAPAEGDLVAVIETSKGTIAAKLFPGYAPQAVKNFTLLAQRQTYNGTSFHRVIQDFIIQGGDPTGSGTGGESAWGVPFPNEISDKLHHYSGALCMASATGEAGQNQSQFYIVATPQNSVPEAAQQALAAAGVREAVVSAYAEAGGAPYLDNTATVFGQVYLGMDVVDAICASSTNANQSPKTTIEILSVAVQAYAAPAASAAVSLPVSSAPASAGTGA